MFFLFFIIFECAFVSRARLGAMYGSSAGARAAAVAGTDPSADFDVLKAVRRAAVAGGDVTRVIVYRAAGPESNIPSDCLIGSVANVCNVYTRVDLNLLESDFAVNGLFTGDDYWPSRTRLSSRSVGTDFVGVYVEARTGAVAPMPSLLSDTSVARIEAVTD